MIEQQLEDFIAAAATAFNDRDWDAYAALFSSDLVMRTPSMPGVAHGRTARVDLVKGIVAAFPDGQIQVERTLASGEHGCIQLLFAGTNTGPMAMADGTEIPATNRAVAFPYCLVVRFDGSNVSEVDEYYDQLSVLSQLDLMP